MVLPHIGRAKVSWTHGPSSRSSAFLRHRQERQGLRGPGSWLQPGRVPISPLAFQTLAFQKLNFRDFPGSQVVKTPRSQCRGLGLDPWSGNWTPRATAESLHKATEGPAYRN